MGGTVIPVGRGVGDVDLKSTESIRGGDAKCRGKKSQTYTRTLVASDQRLS